MIEINRIEAFDSFSSTVVVILPFLTGKICDDFVLAYCHGFRPSKIRVSTGGINMDSMINRITIYINSSNRVESIEQEIEVGLPEGISDGYTLDLKMGNK